MNAKQKINILILDDEAEQLRTLRLGLRRRQFHTETAQNSEEALQKLSDPDAVFDLVLTDYAMPGMNGLTLIKRVRALYGSLPVILMTAFGEKEVLVDALRHQCSGFIEKPFSMDELVDEIKRVLQSCTRKKDNTPSLSEEVPHLLHQYSNPLFSILGSAELGLIEIDNGKPIKKRLTAIIDAVKYLQKINHKVLNAGKRTEKAMEIVNIAELIDNALHSFENLTALKNVSVKLQNRSSCPIKVKGNLFDLEQVFRNLILNAIEAMSECTERKLEIILNTDEQISCADILIRDTGAGIAPVHSDKIFNAYFTTKTEGTGLGLAVVKTILHNHHGDIEVQHLSEQGTSFRVRLPLLVESSDGRDPEMNENPPALPLASGA